MKVCIIVAADPNGVIGKDGQLPWRLPEDLRLFRQRTIGNPIIMGNNTWESIPKKPLDGRANIVISKKHWHVAVNEFGPYTFTSIESAIDAVELSKEGNPLWKFKRDKIFIIGGAKIYEEALKQDLVHEIIMSKIKQKYDGDVTFPKIPDSFEQVSVEYRVDFELILLRKRDKNGS